MADRPRPASPVAPPAADDDRDGDGDRDDDDDDDRDGDDSRSVGAPAITPAQLGVAATVPEDAVARARPALPSIELDVAMARAEAALFGTAEAVKIGRYRVIERAGAGGMGVVWSAWDPDLNRGVALKLASSGDEAARQRARDEGRALARLSHPNVVPIYDVLDHTDGVFLVMELVKGQTLRSAAGEQTPAQLVRAYRQAGEGLAAAHKAGLIHRDFKPDNAILGADGRVRVLDFGLAHTVAADAGEPAIAGTPRYMAPEQRAGAALTAAVDQYGLCTALRESLTAAGGVPRWVAPILARGTADAPADRFPSMDALVHALSLDPRTRWRRRIAVGAAVLAVAGTIGGFTLGRARAVHVEPCAGGPELVAAAWGPARRTEIAGHLEALPGPFAAQSAPRVLGAIDRYRDQWLALHRASCLVHRGGELSNELFDRRTACLARRLASLQAIGDRAAATDPGEVLGLVEAADQLDDLAACADDDALAAGVPPPPPALLASVSPIDDKLARAAVARDAGRLDDARKDADAAVTDARALSASYRPLLARALLARGRVALAGMADDRGAADFGEATHEALVVGDQPIAIEAFARRVWAIGTNVNTPPGVDALAGLELVEALGEHLGDRVGFARALLAANLGWVAVARGDRAAALADFERAHGLAATVTGPGALELTVIDEGLLHLSDDAAERAAIGRELIATLTLRLGADHPRTLRARIVVANVAEDSDRAISELEAACQRLIALHPEIGRSIADCGYEVLWNAIARGDRGRGAIADALLAAGPGVAAPALRIADAYRLIARGDRAAAVAKLEASDRTAKEWWNQMYLADGLAAGALVEAAGAPARAHADAAEAAAIYDDIAPSLPSPLLARRRRALAPLLAP